MRWQNEKAKETGFYTHEQLVANINASHQEQQNEVEDAAAEKKEEVQLKRKKRGSQEHRTRG